ncbi:MAG TPA: HAD-IIIA family hydrolase [Hypericibacter adhaerens]|uniref:D-glycero-alpha-D-manno-heptose-1,7-bisphosphate 7-phosphatase n=1 Tax=Hypericibacter adhaerens TaxID=2602016 RepID=UPI001CD9C337|nr:HAD-IIIA family hydrolase [Hypericibacter adhaerens]HWA46094.1 HAD-IIIA family hydrolase [Hypericibacter adhaerens]
MSASPRRAVFFDRDGTLNRAVIREGRPYPPARLEDMVLMPGAVEALRRLKAAGLFLAVATNQPDVAKGLTSRAAVESMNAWLAARLPIDHVEVCWCLEGPDCKCYKPLPGMLFDAAARHNIRLDQSFMVGDRWRDIGAGKAAGCFTIWLRNDYDTPRAEPDRTVSSLAEAADIILQRCS